jgi:hypothetical protein
MIVINVIPAAPLVDVVTFNHNCCLPDEMLKMQRRHSIDNVALKDTSLRLHVLNSGNSDQLGLVKPSSLPHVVHAEGTMRVIGCITL